MLKGGSANAQIAPRGIRISSSVYGKTIKLAYGLVKVVPDLIWYNDWKSSGSPSNPRLLQVVGGATTKKGSKKGNVKYYSAAIDLLLAHAPIAGVMSIYYNNQKLNVQRCSASGTISGNSFSFTPQASQSLTVVTSTVPGTPYIITVANFVSDNQSSQNNTGVYDNTHGRWLQSADATLPPGPGQYTVDYSGNYTFNAAQSGDSVNIHYRSSTSGAAGTLAAVFAATVNEPIPGAQVQLSLGSNLLANGDFELGPNTQPAPSWTTYRDHAQWAYGGYAYSGTRAYGVLPTAMSVSNPAIQYNQTLAVTPGQAYRLSGAMLCNSLATGAAILLQFYTSGNVFISQSGISSGSQQWTFKTADITVPATAAKMQIVLVNANTTAACYYDAVSLQQVVYLGGHWDRPLWNKAFPVPGIPDSSAYSARDPYSFSWDGTSSAITFPDSSLNGKPITVHYGVPIITKSDLTFYSSTITPLTLLNLEFEPACGQGSEYTNFVSQQDINNWCAGVGSIKFDLGTSDALPNMELEVIGTMTVWANGDAYVADIITDIVTSGATPLTVVQHGVNCNNYANGGYFSPRYPPGNGELLGDIVLTESFSPLVLQPAVPVALLDLHNWTLANGISAALNQDTQRTAKDLLDELSIIGNCAPVYSGDTLKFVPYDEVNQAGFGGNYIAPTASGPVAYLTDTDFVEDKQSGPVKLLRKRRTGLDNCFSLEFTDRDIEYAQNTVTEHDQMAVALYGPRKSGTLDLSVLGIGQASGSKNLKAISNKDVAQKIASIQCKRNAFGVAVYTFSVKAEYFWLEAMDLVAITATKLGLNQVWARITDVKETSNREYEVTAERFVYGLNHPTINGVTIASGSIVTGAIDPGLANAPIIFQPTCAMTNGVPKITFVCSGPDPNFGGAIVNVSIDGGASYNAIGLASPSITGVLTANFNVSSPELDPDTVHTLSVDLTESRGALTSQTVAVADASLDQCYVEIKSGSPLVTTDYEVVCPTTATLTSAYNYNLTTYIRRAVKGTTYAQHLPGWRFAVLDGSALTIDLDNYWVGRTIMVKIQAVNTQGGNATPLATATVYTYTVMPGCDGNYLLINGN